MKSFRPRSLGRLHTWHTPGDSLTLPLTDEKIKFQPLHDKPGILARARHVWTTPAVRTLFLLILFLWAFVQYGRANFYRDPGGIFYDEDRAFDRSYSAWREAEAMSFMKTAEHESATYGGMEFGRSSNNPKVCASFITVRRDRATQYLSNAMGSALEGMNYAERSDLHLKVFFAHVDPSKHPDWTQPWLRKLADDVYSYKNVIDDKAMMRVRNLTAERRLQAKSLFDYTTALQYCLDSTTAPYVAVFEDDIIVAKGWFVRTLKALKDIEKRMSADGKNKDWLFLRLFTQERKTGWASTRIGANNEHWIALGISSALLVFLLLFRRRSHSLRTSLDNWTVFIICMVAVPAFVVLFFQTGKASLMPPAPGVHEESHGISSQAVVFPRDRLPGLIQYLRQREIGHYDMIARDYAQGNDLTRFALYPVQVQHVGKVSASDTSEEEAQASWSMAFENLHPEKLSKEHDRMLHKMYGSNVTKESLRGSPLDW